MTVSNDSPTKEMTMKKKISAGADISKQMIQNATLGAIFLTVFGLFSSIGGSLKGNIVSWQDYALLGTPIIVFLLGLISVVLLRRGNILPSVSLVFIANLALPIVASLLQKGLGWAVFIYALTSSALLIWRAMPKTTRSWTIILTALTLALISIMERIDPPMRVSVTDELAIFFYVASAVLTIAFLIQGIRQAWGIISESLQLKIALWTGLILAGISISLITYSTITARETAIETAKKEALAIAASQANQIRVEAEIPLNMARALAQSLTAAKDPENTYRQMSRSQVNAILRQVLIENQSFLGTYTLWEPDAFDGQDAFYRGKETHDLTGRFIPYWVRGDDGSIDVIPLEGYETAGIGDWYIIPRLTKKEVIIAPLVYPIKGVDTLMASFVVPVIYKDRFYGIAGIDAPISYVQNIVDSVTIYEGKADAFLITSNGTLIGVKDSPDLVNQPITKVMPDFYYAGLQSRVLKGEAFTEVSPDGKDLRVFTPVKLGKTGITWSFVLVLPFNEITASATAPAIGQAIIGLLLTLLGLVLLWFLSRQIVRPLRDLTAVANTVSQGNLNIKAQVLTSDETGVLAKAFNLMIAQLQGLIGTLESRVAERTRNLELAAEVGRTVSQVRALDVMLKDAAELIRQQFDLYYVQVYLADNSQTNLILQSGTGSVGEQLISRRHSLPLNTSSINGRAAVEKKPVVISDTTASATFKPNPLLPDTRSEMAVPLMIGDKVVGVLDMQSEHPDSLNQEILSAFEALAGQLAIAIQNANLLAEAEQARAEVEAQARRLTRANWTEYLDAVHKPEETGFVFEQNKIAPLSQEQAVGENTTAAPITVTGEVLGKLVVELEGGSPIARTDELVNAVARQVAQHIENLRLLDSAERFRFEAEQASRRLTHEGWQEYMVDNAAKGLGYIYDLNEVRLFKQDEEKQVEEAGISLPLKVRDEAVGRIIVKGIEGEEAVTLVNAVAERLGAHIEGLRLSLQTEQALASTKKQAQREQALRQITSAVRGSTDPTVILRTAARELGNILGRQTVVKLATDGKAPAATHENESVPPAEPIIADGGK